MFFIGCQSSPSLPVAVKPCNAIRQRLHFNTVRVLQNSSHDVFFFSLSSSARLWQQLNFLYQQSHGPSVFANNTLYRFKYVILKEVLAKYPRSDGIVGLFHSLFANCHLQLNQPCVPLFGLLFLVQKTNNKCRLLAALSYTHQHNHTLT